MTPHVEVRVGQGFPLVANRQFPPVHPVKLLVAKRHIPLCPAPRELEGPVPEHLVVAVLVLEVAPPVIADDERPQSFQEGPRAVGQDQEPALAG